MYAQKPKISKPFSGGFSHDCSTRRNPFREFSTLDYRINRLFQQSYGDGGEEALTTSMFAPAVDVYETSKISL